MPVEQLLRAYLAHRASKAETLSYLCEIICDLKLMAERAGYKTLAAILAAALVEARIQSNDAKR